MRPEIIVAGDAILDEYVLAVPAEGKEDPMGGPIVHTGVIRRCLGGAANVAHNLARLGCDAWLIARFGLDDAGGSIASMLSEAGVRSGGLVYDGDTATAIKRRYYCPGTLGNWLRADTGCLAFIDHRDRRVAAHLRSHLASVAAERPLVVVFSDYELGTLNAAVLAAVADLLGPPAMVLVDPPRSGQWAPYLGVATIIKANRAQAIAFLMGLGCPSEFPTLFTDERLFAEVVRALRQARSTCQWLWLTFGAGGALLGRVSDGPGDCSRLRVPAGLLAGPTGDVTGCGDTALAAMAAHLATRDFLATSVIAGAVRAVAAAAVAARHHGPYAVSAEDLESALAGQHVWDEL